MSGERFSGSGSIQQQDPSGSAQDVSIISGVLRVDVQRTVIVAELDALPESLVGVIVVADAIPRSTPCIDTELSAMPPPPRTIDVLCINV